MLNCVKKACAALGFRPVIVRTVLTLHQDVHARLVVDLWPLGWKLAVHEFTVASAHVSTANNTEFCDVLIKSMARVVKVFRTLRNHWKKSTFAVCVLSYGGYWLYGKHWWVSQIAAFILSYSTDRFVCFMFSFLCLISDNVLRREACLVARVRHQIVYMRKLSAKDIIQTKALFRLPLVLITIIISFRNLGVNR